MGIGENEKEEGKRLAFPTKCGKVEIRKIGRINLKESIENWFDRYLADTAETVRHASVKRDRRRGRYTAFPAGKTQMKERALLEHGSRSRRKESAGRAHGEQAGFWAGK